MFRGTQWCFMLRQHSYVQHEKGLSMDVQLSTVVWPACGSSACMLSWLLTFSTPFSLLVCRVWWCRVLLNPALACQHAVLRSEGIGTAWIEFVHVDMFWLLACLLAGIASPHCRPPLASAGVHVYVSHVTVYSTAAACWAAGSPCALLHCYTRLAILG